MESGAGDGWPDDPPKNEGGNEDSTWPNDLPNAQNDSDNTIWTPTESLNSPHCLLTIKNGDRTWKSTPTAQDAEQIGKCGNETISVKLKLGTATFSPVMLKYLKFEFHLYEGKLSDTRIAEALVYFNQMQHITVVDLSMDDTQEALEKHHAEAVARSGAMKVSLATSRVTMNTSTQQRSSLNDFDNVEMHNNPKVTSHGSRCDDLTTIKKTLESQGVINIDLLLNKPLIRSGEDFTEVLQHLFSLAHEADTLKHPMDAWFSKSDRSHGLPFGHVPRLDGTLPRGLVKQQPLVRFQNEDQYMITQVVGSVNQAFAELVAAQDVVSTEFSAHVVPLRSSNNNSQFVVIIKPKGPDIYLPTYGETYHIQIPIAKLNRSAVLPDVAEMAESLLNFVHSQCQARAEKFIKYVRGKLSKLMNSEHEDEVILSLRAAYNESPLAHKYRIIDFVMDNTNSLVSNDTETVIEDETIWFPATRMDFKFPKVPHDAQTYLASCPLEARDDTTVDHNARKTISVELPFVELDTSVSLDDYMESVLADEKQQNLTAFVRRTTSDKTIRAEVLAINALHNPESAKQDVAVRARNIDAYKYIQGFQPDNAPSVNLHERFPVLGELSGLDHQSPSSSCPEKIKSQYEKLDSAKKTIIRHLDNLPAGLAFIPGVAGSGKKELIKFIIAACTFGQGTAEPVPTLYLAPNNQAVDDMAIKFQEYFEKLDLAGSPDIIRLYGLDFEFKSVTRLLAPGLDHSYQYFDEDKAQDVIQEMDSEAQSKDPTDLAYQLLEVYQFERMCLDMNKHQKKSCSKRARSTNVSADTAAVAYYRAHIDKYPEIHTILRIGDRDGRLSDDDLKALRMYVKGVFNDMLFDFKGIICTTPVVSANAMVNRFAAQLVFTDEAARQSELSSLISICHYSPCAWFYLGDPEQLKPHVSEEAKLTDNPFLRQMSVSLLERAVLAGVELGWLTVTHRLRGNLSPLPSRINYGNLMTNYLDDMNWTPSTLAFVAEMKKLLGEDTCQTEPSRVVVQFPFSKSTLAGNSSRNITHVRWVISQVKKMFRNPELQNVDSTGKARFLILPLYRAQVDLYRKMLLDERKQRNISDEDYQRIEVRTLDSAQGEERDLVIVDYVQTRKPGFCLDPNRNCLATTRAKQCEILIINAGMVKDSRAEKSKVGQILANAIELGHVLEVPSCTNCQDPSHTDDDCTAVEKTCNWCF